MKSFKGNLVFLHAYSYTKKVLVNNKKSYFAMAAALTLELTWYRAFVFTVCAAVHLIHDFIILLPNNSHPSRFCHTQLLVHLKKHSKIKNWSSLIISMEGCKSCNYCSAGYGCLHAHKSVHNPQAEHKHQQKKKKTFWFHIWKMLSTTNNICKECHAPWVTFCRRITFVP